MHERVLHLHNNPDSSRKYFRVCAEYVKDYSQCEVTLPARKVYIAETDDVVRFDYISSLVDINRHSGMQYSSVHIHEQILFDCIRYMISRVRSPKEATRQPMCKGVTVNLDGIYFDGVLVYVYQSYCDNIKYLEDLYNSYWWQRVENE